MCKQKLYHSKTALETPYFYELQEADATTGLLTELKFHHVVASPLQPDTVVVLLTAVGQAAIR